MPKFIHMLSTQHLPLSKRIEISLRVDHLVEVDEDQFIEFHQNIEPLYRVFVHPGVPVKEMRGILKSLPEKKSRTIIVVMQDLKVLYVKRAAFNRAQGKIEDCIADAELLELW